METERVKISQLQVNEQNPRTCTDKQFEKLVRSVITFPKMLEVRPIVVGEGGVALGGNMRLRALQAIATMTDEEIMRHIEQSAKYNGRPEVEREALLRYWQKWRDDPMVSVARTDNMTEDERREFIIKDNVGFGAWDWDMLANDWDTDELDDWGLSAWVEQPTDEEGDSYEEEEHKEATEDEFNEDAEEIPRRCKECELWQLGRHRLLCGDSTDAEQVKFLMGGAGVNLYLTDPPYNVGYGYEDSAMMSRRKHRTDGLKVMNDKMDNDKFRDFLSSAFSAAEESMEKGAAFYIFHSDSYSLWFREALMSTKDLELRETLIWNKDSLCLGRQDYQWKHEPCLYGWKNGAAHNWFSDRSQTTVIDMPRPKSSKEHPTMKPVPLFAYLMGNSTKEGWNVYDGFAGSGTTLIAAEQLNRNAFLMELDTHYCDVIIARWEKLTGEKAVKIGEFNKEGE